MSDEKRRKTSVVDIVQKEARDWKETVSGIKDVIKAQGLTEDISEGMELEMSEEARNKSREIRNILRSILIFLLPVCFVFVIYSFVWFARVNGTSMEPTYQDGQFVGISMRSDNPSRGDIIVFRQENGDALIKRVIALPGETVQCYEGQVYVDGEPLEESYVDGETEDFDALIVEEDSYFVMGDNREYSTDSRNFGCVKQEDIIGTIIGG